ncbi:MAG TPA: hypothetical protein EYG39_13930 [Rhodothermales bacterium]|nr:hypothetical protein [Rhodothermales bacterium]
MNDTPRPRGEKGSNPYRADLDDGSRIRRTYRMEGGRRVPSGSWRWEVYDPDRSPKRKTVNLRTQSKAAAMRKATELAAQRSLGTFDPWEDAAPTGESLATASEEYLASQKRAGRADSTLAAAKRVLTAFAKSLPAGVSVAHVERAHVERFVTAPKPGKSKKRGAPKTVGAKSPGTVRRYRAVLAHFFSFCIGRGYTRTNPAEGIAMPSARPNRRDHVSPAEVEAMLRALTADEVAAGESLQWLREWILFGVGTGLRPGEQAALRWADVRLGERVVRVRGTKTAASVRSVPLAGEALRVLRQRGDRRRGEGDGPVFTDGNGRPINAAGGKLTKRLKALGTAAGLSKNVTAYGLRHSFGTRMAAAGVPLLDLAKIMGTSVQMIERHYGHYDPARGASHMDRVFGLEDSTEVQSADA